MDPSVCSKKTAPLCPKVLPSKELSGIPTETSHVECEERKDMKPCRGIALTRIIIIMKRAWEDVNFL